MWSSGPPGAPGASYAVGADVEASVDGGNGPCTLAQLSPTSIPNAARYTNPTTFSRSADACVITAPPYECPTRTTGPSIARTYAPTAFASKARLRSGLGDATTSYPDVVSSRITPPNPEASANAPCTSTTVGCMEPDMIIHPSSVGSPTSRGCRRHQRRSFTYSRDGTASRLAIY